MNEFWDKIGCLILTPTFGIWDSRLWEKGETKKTNRKKSQRN